MRKLTLTILHKLPNRIRFQVSERIRDLKSFAYSLKCDNSKIRLRYNFRTNTLLVEFNPDEIYLQEVIYRVVTALSIENGMVPVRLIEEYEAKSLNSLSMYSGAAIMISFLHSLKQVTNNALQTTMNHFALALTTTALVEHAYSETKRKGFFDIELVPALYLIKSYFDNNSISSIALMWLTTFGRHLIVNHSSSKEIKIFRLKDKEGQYHYLADVREDNSIENLSDLVHHVFFNKKKGNRGTEKYITISTK
ncbi:MAG: hypothetical protein SPH94_05400 [Fusobacterium necrophorum]|nr:hypothetical protein [Fusobacterium necrophorum]MCI7681327.1 hypothetical protein [Fusobacterium necrophorum]MDY2573756.1 hypothetical protein [Fusobacterium necrophorum]MDY6172614.1 hypothetical protein [Fusobacterium necrophorum]